MPTYYWVNNTGIIFDGVWSGSAAPIQPLNYGCNDEYAQNYNPDANANDGSCYGYPSIGDVDLLFDGFDDYVEIINNGIITNTNNLTNDFTINLSFIKYSNVQDYEGVNLVSLGDGTIW